VLETIEVQEIKVIPRDRLLEECDALFGTGYRLVQICSLNIPEGFEMNYSFGKDFHMVTIRFSVGFDEAVPSITHIWKGAFLYENEIKDLYGVNIENMAVDYNGKFYDVDGIHPFAAKRPESEA
jgi:ech hydrogenase subunit D